MFLSIKTNFHHTMKFLKTMSYRKNVKYHLLNTGLDTLETHDNYCSVNGINYSNDIAITFTSVIPSLFKKCKNVIRMKVDCMCNCNS